MNKMTAQEIIDFLKSKNVPVQALMCDDYEDYIDSDEYEDENSEIYWLDREDIKSVLGEIKRVNSYGQGSHYDGQEVECVVHLVDHNIYIRSTDLYYNSYDGLQFDDMHWERIYEALPIERTVVVYEKKD